MYIRKQVKHALIFVLIVISLLGCNQKADVLAGTSWELVSLNGKDLIEGTSITLEFTETYLGGQMECNGYGGTPDSGSYLAKNNGAFELSLPFAVTVQLCTEPEGIMEQEEAYVEALMNATNFRMVGNRLEIDTEGGEIILIFQAT